MSHTRYNDTQILPDEKRCVILGAGPAGLTAAYELSEVEVTPVVLEQDEIVGGISRTVEYKDYRFDIGGHRFFTKVQLIDEWWTKLLGAEFLVRPRLSRIYYNGQYFDYPLKPFNAIARLGPLETVRIGLSYIRSQIFPYHEEKNLEQWVSNRFGRRLYEIFFKGYTEKVWGMKCTEIGADWAAQRIKNLDLKAAVKNMFLGNSGKEIATLIEEFRYPRLGPGMMWERATEILAERGFPVRLGHTVTKIHLAEGRVVAVTAIDKDGNEVREAGSHFISSLPIRNLVNAFDPPAPPDVLEAANKLRYRDFLTVGLIVNRSEVFPDNWIYIHSTKVKVGRVQNFKNWSMDMVPDDSMSSIGLEYFVQVDDELWCAEDQDLIKLGRKECATLGLVKEEEVVDGVVIRMPKAYPVYDQSYRESLMIIRGYLDTIPNLQLIGRNGQHRYNNQDHSMLTAIYAARNVSGANYDVWDINVEAAYHEEAKPGHAGGVTGDRLVPQPLRLEPLEVLQRAFARYDPIALGSALAVILGVGLFSVTMILLLKGGDSVGPNLSLLGNYLLGYRVTWAGAIIGLVESVIGGFLLGFGMAHTINAVIGWHERHLIRRLEVTSTLRKPYLDPPT